MKVGAPPDDDEPRAEGGQERTHKLEALADVFHAVRALWVVKHVEKRDRAAEEVAQVSEQIFDWARHRGSQCGICAPPASSSRLLVELVYGQRMQELIQANRLLNLGSSLGRAKSLSKPVDCTISSHWGLVILLWSGGDILRPAAICRLCTLLRRI